MILHCLISNDRFQKVLASLRPTSETRANPAALRLRRGTTYSGIGLARDFVRWMILALLVLRFHVADFFLSGLLNGLLRPA